MDEGEEKKAEHSNCELPQQLCRFFSQGRHCNYGKKCRFLHIRDNAKAQEMETIQNANASHLTSTTADGDGGNAVQKANRTNSKRFAPAASSRPCRYFLSGYCAMEDRCRFWHPAQLLSVDDQPGRGYNSHPAPGMAAVPHPRVPHEVKLCELTEDVAKKLRDIEIEQLQKRIPREQLIIQEQNGLAYYRATVAATDPDWVNVSTFYILIRVKIHLVGRESRPCMV